MQKAKLLGLIFALAYLTLLSECHAIETEPFTFSEEDNYPDKRVFSFLSAKLKSFVKALKEKERRLRDKYVMKLDPNNLAASKIFANSFY